MKICAGCGVRTGVKAVEIEVKINLTTCSLDTFLNTPESTKKTPTKTIKRETQRTPTQLGVVTFKGKNMIVTYNISPI